MKHLRSHMGEGENGCYQDHKGNSADMKESTVLGLVKSNMGDVKMEQHQQQQQQQHQVDDVPAIVFHDTLAPLVPKTSQQSNKRYVDVKKEQIWNHEVFGELFSHIGVYVKFPVFSPEKQ